MCMLKFTPEEEIAALSIFVLVTAGRGPVRVQVLITVYTCCRRRNQAKVHCLQHYLNVKVRVSPSGIVGFLVRIVLQT